jgi:hypothetical protein
VNACPGNGIEVQDLLVLAAGGNERRCHICLSAYHQHNTTIIISIITIIITLISIILFIIIIIMSVIISIIIIITIIINIRTIIIISNIIIINTTICYCLPVATLVLECQVAWLEEFRTLHWHQMWQVCLAVLFAPFDDLPVVMLAYHLMMLIAMLPGSSPSALPQLVMLCQVGLLMVQGAWVVHLQVLVQASLAVYITVLSVFFCGPCVC